MTVILHDQNTMICSSSFMEYISDFLDDEGGITILSTDKLINAMKETNDKLVPKCVAITIISLSSNDVQIKLCDTGVWNILFQWLQDAVKNDTNCFILEILQLYLALPISFDVLTSNSCPKLIKKLTKNSNPDIIAMSKNIVTKWKRIVEERTSIENTEVPIKKLKLDDSIIKIDNVPEEKKKIRTVKVKNTDFRSTGVEDLEIDLTKPLKKLPKKLDDKFGMEELHQKVSANVEKRKVVEIHESKNFINSIIHTPAIPRKKKKRPDSIINKSTSDISLTEESPIDAKESPVADSQSVSEKSKKRVSWAPTDYLQNIKFFELDENERVNVNKVSIEEMKKKERMIERQHASHKFSAEDIDDDIQTEKWYKPLAVLGISDNKIEVTSVERTVQFERERKVLKVLYFDKQAIPLSPYEPDNESYDVKEPINIPLEDVIAQKSGNKTAVSSDSNSKLLIYTEKDHVSLRPDVANLLKSITSGSPMIPTIPVSTTSEPAFNDPEAVQTRLKLINIIRSRHPEIDPEKLTSEEVCKLLEPMRDQLIREGILSMPVNQSIGIPRPNFIPNQVPPWFSEPRAHFPRHPQDLQMMQRMPPMPFYPGIPLGMMPPPPNRPTIPPMPQQIRPVCRFILTNGYCRLGNNCNYSHIHPDGPRHYNQNRH